MHAPVCAVIDAATAPFLTFRNKKIQKILQIAHVTELHGCVVIVLSGQKALREANVTGVQRRFMPQRTGCMRALRTALQTGACSDRCAPVR